jgi:hypothetical protein
VDWTRVQRAFREARGVPVVVSVDPVMMARGDR